ncbi:hypothetical protein DDY07_23590 [Methylomonas sp. ZR1]|nr:hypothetical protein [Methylomonas sp. ZR1]
MTPHASDVHKSQVLIFAGAKIIFQAGRPEKDNFKDSQMHKYIYRMKRLNGSSDRYGPCEHCDKHVDSTYYMNKMRVYISRLGVESVTFHKDMFGHRVCLADSTVL